MRFGTIRNRASITATASIRPRKGAISAARNRSSYTSAADTNSTADPISTSGYAMEMGSPHARHRPRSSRYESTGTLSIARRGVPQLGQRDLGRTMDSRRGTRWMRTVRNDPTTRPRTANNARRTAAMLPTCVERAHDVSELVPVGGADPTADGNLQQAVVIDVGATTEVDRSVRNGRTGRVA